MTFSGVKISSDELRVMIAVINSLVTAMLFSSLRILREVMALEYINAMLVARLNTIATSAKVIVYTLH